MTRLLRMVMEDVLKGWPYEKEQVDELAGEYWSFKEDLSGEDGCCLHQTEW